MGNNCLHCISDLATQKDVQQTILFSNFYSTAKFSSGPIKPNIHHKTVYFTTFRSILKPSWSGRPMWRRPLGKSLFFPSTKLYLFFKFGKKILPMNRHIITAKPRKTLTHILRDANGHFLNRWHHALMVHRYVEPQVTHRIYMLEKTVRTTGVFTWIYSVRVLNTCLATFMALEKFLWPCSSITSLPE